MHKNESIIRTWAALAAVSLGIIAIPPDGSMMPVAIGVMILVTLLMRPTGKSLSRLIRAR